MTFDTACAAALEFRSTLPPTAVLTWFWIWQIGFTGCICDEKRGKALRELVPIVPLSQLMIETDAPFMMPTGGRGRNEPSNLPAILRTVAECHGVGEDDAARATTANAVEFFQLEN